MSKESYIRGFCKAASHAGVNPKLLAKYAGFDELIDELAKADVKSDPSLYNIGQLANIDISKLPMSAFRITGKDYLENMGKVAPGVAQALFHGAKPQNWAFLNEPLLSNDLLEKRKDAVGGLTSTLKNVASSGKVYDRARRNVAIANYANITNLLDKVQDPRNPVWDVANARAITDKPKTVDSATVPVSKR